MVWYYRKMDKTEFKVFLAVIKGNNSLASISKNTKISIPRVSQIINNLVESNFCRKEIKNRFVYCYISKTGFVQELIKFINETPLFKFEEVLTGLNLRILSLCVFSPKSSKVLAKMLKTSQKAVRNRLYTLKNVTALTSEKGFYSIDRRNHLHLERFLEQYRLFYPHPVNILWKFEDEIIYEAENKKEVRGVLTGLSRYEDLRIPLYFTRFCCYFPKKKLSKEEIFIHSILEIDAIRVEELVLAFYLKHKMNMKRLRELAEKYDCSEKLRDLNRVLRMEKPKELHSISEKELKEFFQQYKIKWKKHLIKKV